MNAIEAWGVAHPVQLAVSLAFLSSMLLSPFSNDIRALYSAAPKGFQSVVRALRLSKLRRLRSQIKDPSAFAQRALTRCCVVALIGVWLGYKVMEFEGLRFDKEHPGPLSTVEKAYANSRTILDFEGVFFMTLAGIAVAAIFTVWQYRSPHARAEILESRLQPISKYEIYFLQRLD